MSSTEKNQKTLYAASMELHNGKSKEWSQISRSKLIKLTKEFNIDYLGTDNPTEILKAGESLSSFCNLLPVTCSFVHVNLTSSGLMIPLRKLLVDYDLSPPNKKLSPLLTARALLQLIKEGVGMVLEPFENETIIEVGRPRGSSKGGWSQSRYARQNEEVIARAASQIKGKLDEIGHQYDEVIRKTKYGAKMARYHVFTAKPDLASNFNDLNLYPAKLKIWSPRKSVITHKPIRAHDSAEKESYLKNFQRIIVGIDPGITTGVAISNLKGTFLGVFSKKNLSKGELVTRLTTYGIPILICADVYPVPAFVSKLASTYNAEVVYPSIEMSKEEKRLLSKKSNVSFKLNSHEIDAVSGVMKALNRFSTKFEKIENSDLTNKEQELAKGLVIRGLSVSDSLSSVKSLRRSDDSKPSQPASQHDPQIELVGRVNNLLEEMAVGEETIMNLRAHSARLESRVSGLEKKINNLKRKFNKKQHELTIQVLTSELIEAKDLQIKFLQKSLDDQVNLKNQYLDNAQTLEKLLWMSMEEDTIPIKVLTVFSHDAIHQLRNEKGINDGDVLLILDPTGGGPQTTYNLIQSKLRMIFLKNSNLSPESEEIFFDNDIPVISATNYGISQMGQFAIIKKNNLDRALLDVKEMRENRKLRKKARKIDIEIENYQYERSKFIESTFRNYDDFEPEEEDLGT